VPQELELRWQEYYELITVLLQWIRHHILVFEERKFPASYEEIEVGGPAGGERGDHRHHIYNICVQGF